MADALGLYYAYKIVKLMAKPWDKWHAFELGLIDDEGKTLKKAKTSEEKEAMGKFGILVRNLKRILEKMPFGKSRTASLAAALYLLKEDEQAVKYGVEDIAKKILWEVNDGICYAELSQVILENTLDDDKTIKINLLLSEHICKTYNQTEETFLEFPVYEGKDLLTGKYIKFLKEDVTC